MLGDLIETPLILYICQAHLGTYKICMCCYEENYYIFSMV